ncbi:MAG: hypothetical protein J2P17_31710 [Mycobacterium sp.]|nr:hypothetical protein [Mycobacterium sp.]
MTWPGSSPMARSTLAPSPLPWVDGTDAIEVERIMARGGTVSLTGHAVLAAEILGGRRVGIRIEPAALMFYDLATRELKG